MSLKTVFSTTQAMEAEFIRALLEQHGIESNLENEFASQLGLGYQAPIIPLLITVHETKEKEALEIIRTRPKAGRPPASSMQPGFKSITCSFCGKLLDVLDGEDPPEECPWCGKPPIRPS